MIQLYCPFEQKCQRQFLHAGKAENQNKTISCRYKIPSSTIRLLSITRITIDYENCICLQSKCTFCELKLRSSRCSLGVKEVQKNRRKFQMIKIHSSDLVAVLSAPPSFGFVSSSPSRTNSSGSGARGRNSSFGYILKNISLA